MFFYQRRFRELQFDKKTTIGCLPVRFFTISLVCLPAPVRVPCFDRLSSKTERNCQLCVGQEMIIPLKPEQQACCWVSETSVNVRFVFAPRALHIYRDPSLRDINSTNHNHILDYQSSLLHASTPPISHSNLRAKRIHLQARPFAALTTGTLALPPNTVDPSSTSAATDPGPGFTPTPVPDRQTLEARHKALGTGIDDKGWYTAYG